MGKDRLASKNIKPPPVLENPGCTSFVDDAFLTTPDVSSDLSNRPGNLSAKEWQELSDHLKAIEVASQEWRCSSSGLNTPLDPVSTSGSHTLGSDTPQDGPALCRYAPKEFREEQLAGHFTCTGTAIPSRTTPSVTPAAGSSGPTAATPSGQMVANPACPPAGALTNPPAAASTSSAVDSLVVASVATSPTSAAPEGEM